MASLKRVKEESVRDCGILLMILYLKTQTYELYEKREREKGMRGFVEVGLMGIYIDIIVRRGGCGEMFLGFLLSMYSKVDSR